MITKAQITLVRSLHSKKGRDEAGLYIAEGPKLVSEAISTNQDIAAIYATEGHETTNANTVSQKDMERISSMKTPQGVLAVIRKPYQAGAITPSLLPSDITLALDDIQDPGNLGTIIRTADWFGIKSILCSKATADCFSPKTIQSSMGSIFRVACIYTDLQHELKKIAAQKIPVYGTFLKGEDLYEIAEKHKGAGIILLGNEGNGISKEMESIVTHRITIPRFGTSLQRSESLNVAVAAAVICAEFRRAGRME